MKRPRFTIKLGMLAVANVALACGIVRAGAGLLFIDGGESSLDHLGVAPVREIAGEGNACHGDAVERGGGPTMKRPKVRIGTLMLLVVIAALVVALVVEKRQSAKIAEELRAERDSARMSIEVALANARSVQVQAALRALSSANRMKPDAAKAYDVDEVVFAEIAKKVASEDLGGVPVEEVEADLAAITEGLPQPVDLGDASAHYVVYRREKKQARERAAKSARGDLRIKAAVGTISGAGAK